ncbi:MAG TPA: DJ-1/PfpI family protein [Nitrospiraceae bacterium]|nr:DJ-1/PfpI family protein [Nitrospiraceae bacterium]
MTNETNHEKIVLVAYPGMTALDMLGPQTLFACVTGVTVMIAAQTLDPVTCDTGLKLIPDVDFGSCPREVDLFLLPGGLDGTTAAMKDRRTIGFVGELGAHSKYVTSVCTGSLILGAAGLLKGYRATSHWVGVHLLRSFGATPVKERVVVDRNRITGAGVTAGMDMALTVIKMLRGEEYAKMVALLTEYDPAPPVHTGSPHAAGAKLTDMARGRFEDWLRDAQTVAMGFVH